MVFSNKIQAEFIMMKGGDADKKYIQLKEMKSPVM